MGQGVTMSNNRPLIVNAMTVDVEDYFQVSALENAFPRATWGRTESRVTANVQRVLALFAEHEIQATFFVLGWLAERYPELVRAIVSAGHELASHGYEHVRVTQQSPDEFRTDVKRTKQLLEDIGGVQVGGYRAASYSINANNLWALEVLAEADYKYSSSIYPIRHDHYGMPEAPRFRFTPENVDGFFEVPVSTVEVCGANWPCGGGGYFRLLPYAYSRWAIRRVNTADGKPTVFYFHPWEIDPQQPRASGIGTRARLRHYTNLSRMESKLQRLCADFRWDRMDKVYDAGCQPGI